MRIFHVIDTLSLGGAERHLIQTIGHLARRGVAQKVAVLHRHDRDETFLGELARQKIETVALGSGHGVASLPLKCLPLFKHCRDFRPNLISTQLIMSDIVGRLVARALAIPTVSTWHTTEYDNISSLGLRLRGRMAMNFLESLDRISAGWGGQFIAVSKAVAESYCRILCIAPSRCAIIPDTLDLTRFPAKPAQRKPSGAGLRLIHVGRHHPQKGLGTLLQALALIPEKIDFSMDLFGTGPLTANLQKDASRLGIDHRLHFRGQLTEVAPFLLDSDIFIFPSLYEGFGIAYAEALAAGLPVIASDLPVLREIDPDGQATQFFTPGDPAALARAIRELLLDPEKRLRLGSKARCLAEPFDSEKLGARYYQFLKTLI